MSNETENIQQNITKTSRYMAVERRVILNGSLVNMRTGNWVDVTVKGKEFSIWIVHTPGLALLICRN